MPKITEYPSANAFDENDVLLKDGLNGTKIIPVDKVKEYMADGLATDEEVAELKNDFLFVASRENIIDYSTTKNRNGIINTSGRWSTSSPFRSYYFDDVSGIFKMSVTTNGTNGTRIGLLKNDTFLAGQVPPYCTGTSAIYLDADETTIIDVPKDCTYILIGMTGPDSADLTPASTTFYKYLHVPNVDDTLSASGEAADANVVGNNFTDISAMMGDKISIDVVGADVIDSTIAAAGSWTSAGTSSIVKIPYGASILKTKGNSKN